MLNLLGLQLSSKCSMNRVKRIPNDIFKDCVYLTEVMSPDTTTQISSGAFEDFIKLTNIIHVNYTLSDFTGDAFPTLQEQICDCWLPDSRYRQTDDYEVEVYYLYLKDEKHKRHYEIWVPIEKLLLYRSEQIKVVFSFEEL